ncbi:peptidase C39 family protein [Roseomonas sp. E05]|uniref:peptidase C39 family protein n=1 Tax=Roseomonas sp. E05 TaxID=3046310 RepID=UPI0024BADC34|nr:peptidase C39 family protein [Roseomonas sp. E05]MDJ0387282.1 peptidase C39 family protein [Roseomonas sp. E05]
MSQAVLATAMPDALRARREALHDFPGTLWLAEGPEAAPQGAILALRRPTGALLRIAGFWVDAAAPDREAIARRLAARLEAAARREGVLVLRAPAGTVEDGLDPALLPLLGLGGEGGASYAERWLDNDVPVPRRAIPLYPQSTRFTCGPASLLMGFGALTGRPVTRSEEIALWREASSIVAQSGPGGCDPFGLALAAQARGFAPEILVTTERPTLTERVDTDEKRDLIDFVQAGFRARVAEAGIPVRLGGFAVTDLAAPVAEGAPVLLLVSQFPTHGRYTPHWILLHHAWSDRFLVNDPWPDPLRQETAADAEHLPLRAEALELMAWYGEPPYRAALILRRPVDAVHKGADPGISTVPG